MQSTASLPEVKSDSTASITERRLHMQAYQLWLSLHQGGGLPDARELIAHPECTIAKNLS